MDESTIIGIRVNVCVLMFESICVCMYICISVHVCMYVCMYVCTDVHIY